MTELEQQAFHKEIDLIQSCISRMANNSFLVKGWLISLLAIIFTIKGNDMNNYLIFPLLSLILAFWFLDAFFLRAERLYRKLYKWVIEHRKNNILYFQYDLDLYRLSEINKDHSIIKVMFSNTILIFYGSVFVVMCVLFGVIEYATSFL